MHPLALLTVEEIETAVKIVKEQLVERGVSLQHLRFESVELKEPACMLKSAIIQGELPEEVLPSKCRNRNVESAVIDYRYLIEDETPELCYAGRTSKSSAH